MRTGTVTAVIPEDRSAVAPEVRLGPRHAAPLLDTLSVIPDKKALFAVDTYFRDSWEDLGELPADRVEVILRQHALLLLKPDAVVGRRLHAALHWATEQGTVVAAERVRVDRHGIRAMWRYQWNVASRDRRDLSDLLGADGGDALLLILRLPADTRPATVRISEAKGSADPAKRQPWQLRHRLGNENFLLNFVHAADEPADLVREIGVLFDAPQRRALYRKVAAGADARSTALAEIEALYADHPPRDLSLSGLVKRTYERLDERTDPAARDLAAALSGTEVGLNADWRGLCDLAERAGVPLDGWDRAVLGTHLMVASESGTVPILAGVPVREWDARTDPAMLPAGWTGRRAAAPVRPVARPRTGRPALRYDRPVASGLVHKAGIDEVFVTDSAQLAQHRYLLAAELPSTHVHYNDLLSGTARYDLMALLELVRQSGYVVTHGHLGVPVDHPFLLRDVTLDLDRAMVFADQDDRLRVCADFTIEALYEAPMAGLRARIVMSTPDGRMLATGGVSGSWITPKAYAGMRSGVRRALGLPAVAGPVPPPRGALLAPARVGRTSVRNVVLTTENEVAVDTTYRGLFDHEQDHVPGMLLIEAARQAVFAGLGDRPGRAGESALRGLTGSFAAIAELDRPLQVLTAADGTIRMRQNGSDVCRIDTRVEHRP
jgi:hypothetical protein